MCYTFFQGARRYRPRVQSFGGIFVTFMFVDLASCFIYVLDDNIPMTTDDKEMYSTFFSGPRIFVFSTIPL